MHSLDQFIKRVAEVVLDYCSYLGVSTSVPIEQLSASLDAEQLLALKKLLLKPVTQTKKPDRIPILTYLVNQYIYFRAELINANSLTGESWSKLTGELEVFFKNLAKLCDNQSIDIEMPKRVKLSGLPGGSQLRGKIESTLIRGDWQHAIKVSVCTYKLSIYATNLKLQYREHTDKIAAIDKQISDIQGFLCTVLTDTKLSQFEQQVCASITSLEGEVAELKEKVTEQSAHQQAIEELQASMAELNEAIANPSLGEAEKAQIAILETRVGELETSERALTSRFEEAQFQVADLSGKLAASDSKIQELETTVLALKKVLGQLTSKLDETDKKVGVHDTRLRARGRNQFFTAKSDKEPQRDDLVVTLDESAVNCN